MNEHTRAKRCTRIFFSLGIKQSRLMNINKMALYTREKERERERETDRQTDRQTDRDRDRDRGRERVREKEKES